MFLELVGVTYDIHFMYASKTQQCSVVQKLEFGQLQISGK